MGDLMTARLTDSGSSAGAITGIPVAGVKAAIISALRTGRTPRLTKEQRAIYDFIAELHKTKRVADKTYTRAHALFGDEGMVEFVGIIGYYTLVAMTLNVFRMPVPDGTLPFKEPAVR